MSVVESHKRALYSVPGKERCTFCGEQAFVPYVEWLAAPTVDEEGWEEPRTLIVCVKCVSAVLRGFGRDLRDLVALRQFRAFCSRPVQSTDVRQ
jgi:hypothetical protein